ncbi:MAG: glutathionylspermidine synthase family protein [Gemmataceae bacterium]|nr:glutathionylspermidine synthase family protein [Gemmataceae bacterium]
MKRIPMQPRPDWQKQMEDLGVFFHTLNGEPYWNEAAAYQFSTHEVDLLELATNKLHQMCMLIVEQVIEENLFHLFRIPRDFQPMIIRSWERRDLSLYGRFDLAYRPGDTPRMLEYNADTPTALVEASVAQWFWLKDIDPNGDQFNSIHERLIAAWKKIRELDDRPTHFAALRGQIEDYVTVEYLRDTAMQAGLNTHYLDIERVGYERESRFFVDDRDTLIFRMFKLYPWEWMMRESFGPHLAASPTTWIEPPWKMILSCKAILPLLYERFPKSPFLVPASFEPLPGDYLKKPIHAREGSNISVVIDGRTVLQTDGPYTDGPFIYQQLAPVYRENDLTAVIGSWIIDGESCGIGIREANSLITQNTSLFVPHQMIDVPGEKPHPLVIANDEVPEEETGFTTQPLANMGRGKSDSSEAIRV